MTLREKFDLLTLSTALGVTMLAFVLGVALVTHGAVRLAIALSDWLAGR